ncbi:MAG: DNA translocase FtsK 4TM domain-containing protein [Thermoleophilaceae bacterium]|nr:DNA translocase FtsK 4TM domain-containing protein [Thermoleophilaceae bacterium]
MATAAKKKKKPATRAATRRAPAPKRAAKPASRTRKPEGRNEQRDDAVGLLLLAIAAFFGCMLYLGWEGGQLGAAAVTGMVFLIGKAVYLVPIALAAAGLALIMRPKLPPMSMRAPGAIMMASGVLLALAAGMFGLGDDQPAKHVVFNQAYFEGHGGVIGEALYYIVASLLQTLGANIVAVALFVIGLQQLTGKSVFAIGRKLVGMPRAVAGSRGPRSAQTAAASNFKQSKPVEDMHPPEPEGVEPIIHATHVEAPAFDDTAETDAIEPDDLPEAEFLTGEDESATQLLDDANASSDNNVNRTSTKVLGEPTEVDDDQSSRQFPRLGADLAAITESDGLTYRLPKSRILERTKEKPKSDNGAQEKVGKQLIETLGHFGINADLIGTVSGPHITRYELRLAPGTKMNKVAQLKDDLAYALASTDIRILAPIPGKQAVGIEVPNLTRRMVRLGDIFQPHPDDYSPLSVWLGKDIAGKAIGTDISKMPHLLVAGTTGAGKSGAINAMLCSILLRATPNDARLVLIDPKQVELNLYEQIPHLLTPVVTSPRMAANVLANLIREMEQRYTLMSAYKVRNIKELNDRRKTEGDNPLPYILCVIDELADLMMVAPAEVEDAIIRLAQKSRAVGIHLLLATQRPSADIITGMIKANVPSRIAFAVSSQTDSRVVLDQNGAESLLGQGDMLFSPIGSSRMERIQGAFVTEEEIMQITDYWRKQGEPEFHNELLESVETEKEDRDGLDPNTDDLLAEAIELVVEMGTASTSMLQRRLRVGYTRAGRLIDMMERRNVISGYEGSKPRQVLISAMDVPRILEHLAGDGVGEQLQLAADVPPPSGEDTLEQSVDTES